MAGVAAAILLPSYRWTQYTKKNKAKGTTDPESRASTPKPAHFTLLIVHQMINLIIYILVNQGCLFLAAKVVLAETSGDAAKVTHLR